MLNTHPMDRLVRALAAILLLELGVFWLGGPAQWLALTGALVLLVTGWSGFCPLYRLLGVHTGTAGTPTPGTGKKLAAWLVLALVLLAGSYASLVASRKIFLEDFNRMNDAYKQTLFLTGKAQRESAQVQYARLVPALQDFVSTYTHYQPLSLRGDTRLAEDFRQVTQWVTDAGPLVQHGDLQEAHLMLEKVRPIFQEMFKRNGFSMLAVALVDFHDAMEQVLEAANRQDSARLVALYPEVSEKLQAVEAQAQDAEIQAIRKHLDAIEAAARTPQADRLPALGEALKSSFVKVYLQRG